MEFVNFPYQLGPFVSPQEVEEQALKPPSEGVTRTQAHFKTDIEIQNVKTDLFPSQYLGMLQAYTKPVQSFILGQINDWPTCLSTYLVGQGQICFVT